MAHVIMRTTRIREQDEATIGPAVGWWISLQVLWLMRLHLGTDGRRKGIRRVPQVLRSVSHSTVLHTILPTSSAQYISAYYYCQHILRAPSTTYSVSTPLHSALLFAMHLFTALFPTSRRQKFLLKSSLWISQNDLSAAFATSLSTKHAHFSCTDTCTITHHMIAPPQTR